MKKISALVLIIFLLSGCGWFKKEKPVIKIGEIEITLEEFNKAFESSRFFKEGHIKRKEFLKEFINRKLLLKEAERLGLDKDPQFLDEIQRFWEQALLKRILSKKLREISSQVKVTEKEIKEYYSTHKEKFPEKDISQVYDQIKWLIFSQKRREALEEWIDSLKKSTNIKIDYKSLGIDSP